MIGQFAAANSDDILQSIFDWADRHDIPDIQSYETQTNRNEERLIGVPRDKKALLELNCLNLSGLRLTHIPQEIGFLTNLKVIDLSNNRINHLPHTLPNLHCLFELYLDYFLLEEIPLVVFEITSLKKFHFSVCYKNALVLLPGIILNLSNLEELRLSNLISIPAEIGALKRLKSLYLNGDCLMDKSWPKELAQLKALESLELEGFVLQELPSEIGYLNNLEYLNVNSCGFWKFPEEIGNLTNLKEIHASSNRLQKLPLVICKLSQLEKLSLTGNKIYSMPEEVGGLINLSELYLDHNIIPSLPESLGLLKKLTILGLRENKITKVPETFAELLKTGLRMDLEWNPLDMATMSKELKNNIEEQASLDYLIYLHGGLEDEDDRSCLTLEPPY